MKSWVLAASALALALGATSPSRAAESAADTRFKALYTQEWTWRQAQRLEDDEDDSGVIAPDLPRVDAASQAARLAYWTDVMAQLDRISPASLSDKEQVNYQVYRAQIAVLINDQRFRDYEKPLTADTAFWTYPAATARGDFKTLADYRNYISQLNDLPRYFREETQNMRAGLARGFTPPRVTLAGRDQAIASVAKAKTAQDTVYYKPFQSMPAVIPAAEQARLRAQGLAAITDAVIPAHKTLLAFVRDDYIPHAREPLGASSLLDGRAYYQAKLLEFATTDMTPEQIHQLGLEEGAKIRAEMLAVMKDTGFKGDLPAFLHFLRTDPQFYAKTPQELLMRTAYVAKLFDGVASNYFGYLPRARFAIKPVPAEEAPFYTSGRGGPGVYLVNTYDLPSRGLYSMPALTLHESAPGHAFQMPIALERKDLPPFRRVYISAYGEGWALYCERLGSEMGMYRSAYETFGMLSYQAWRAARLVVDTGIHTQGWTREQAQDYLRANTALSNHEIETEVDRYISWPGQAVSYYLGEAAIWKARHKAEAALGSKFNIRAFHDAVLELGSVPLPVLDAHIDRFIANGGKGPYPDME
jgi:uncharacterized protein (DUF885 family)